MQMNNLNYLFFRCCSREEITFLAFYRRVERNWPKDEETIVADKRLPLYVAHLAKMVHDLEAHPQYVAHVLKTELLQDQLI